MFPVHLIFWWIKKKLVYSKFRNSTSEWYRHHWILNSDRKCPNHYDLRKNRTCLSRKIMLLLREVTQPTPVHSNTSRPWWCVIRLLHCTYRYTWGQLGEQECVASLFNILREKNCIQQIWNQHVKLINTQTTAFSVLTKNALTIMIYEK